MAAKLCDHLWERYRVGCITLGSERIVPGMILDAEWPWFAELLNLPPYLAGERERAWETLKLPEGDFPNEEFQASVIKEATYGKVTVEAGASLPQFGFEFSGKLDVEFKGVLTIGPTTTRAFTDMTAGRRLLSALVELEKAGDGRWPWIHDDFLATDCFYTNSLVAEFKKSGGIEARAAFTEAGITAKGNLTIEWLNDSTFELVGDATVPFGVRGLRINKNELRKVFG